MYIKNNTEINKDYIDYSELLAALKNLLEHESDWLANLANISSLLNEYIPHINWVGFYFYKKKELIVGPFQGKVACTRIALGKGVCGTAAEQLKTILVKDVHDFIGHISCDSASRSEIVIPLFKNHAQKSLDTLIGVLDIDSPKLARFTEDDKIGLEKIANLISEKIIWPELFI
ncbi:GAF domain-containing protein [Fluviispira multicolorata]|uniref:GAF domain-containing protein n=1 Tax=Fluviispira multicolorata TaxID=2654512 RepID=A0A833JGM9_9BACT|nr:GAF domain-containing protein [Fluviispira multicolorata]KAB8032216.1 GAF domain-containing protein [Fluviispira multicolorata]